MPSRLERVANLTVSAACRLGSLRSAGKAGRRPAGAVTIGRQSWLSADGANWVVGPEIPGYEIGDYGRPTGSANSASVVITNGNAAWTASVADLNAGRYSGTARLAERPIVGSSY